MKIKKPDIIHTILDKLLIEINLRIFLIHLSNFVIIIIFLLICYYFIKRARIAAFNFTARNLYEKKIIASIKTLKSAMNTIDKLQKYSIVFILIVFLFALILLTLQKFAQLQIASKLLFQSIINITLIFLIFLVLFVAFKHFIKRYTKLKKSKIILKRGATAALFWLFFICLFLSISLYVLIPLMIHVNNVHLKLMNRSIENYTTTVQSNMLALAVDDQVRLEFQDKYSIEGKQTFNLWDVTKYKNSIKNFSKFVPFLLLSWIAVYVLIPFFIYSKKKTLLAALSLIVGYLCAHFLKRFLVDVLQLELNQLIISLPIASITYILSMWISMITSEN